MHAPPRAPRYTRRALLAAAALAPLAAAATADGPARIRPGAVRSALLDIVQAGPRLVAAGERGHVLLSDDQGKSWRQARSVPTRTTLTCLHALDARTLWAAGHGGIVLRSSDGGETWVLAAGRVDATEVLLSIRVDGDGRGLAVGGFGFALVTADAGQTWKPQTLLDGEAGERHLNRILVSRSGTWYIAAEGGQVLRSTDRARWTALTTPYKGSLWTGVQLPGGALLLGGMRGNLVRSPDDGQTWTHLPVPKAGSLTGAAVLADGRPVLVGVDGTVVLGDPAGTEFTMSRLEDRSTLTGVVVTGAGSMAAVGTAGVRLLDVPR